MMIESIVAITIAIISISISILSFAHTKRELYVRTITDKRIKNMETLTGLLQNFIESYSKGDIEEAKKTRCFIAMYFSPGNSAQSAVLMKIDKIIQTMKVGEQNDIINVYGLIETSQIMFKNIWEESRAETYSRKFRKNKFNQGYNEKSF